jgi:hypothetical protein
VGKPGEIDHKKDLDVWRIILKSILEKYDGVVWIGLIWLLRIESSGWLF